MRIRKPRSTRPVAGDEIHVAAGVYAGVISRGGTMQAAYVDKSITLRGGYKLADWTLDPANNPTTLDAQGRGACSPSAAMLRRSSKVYV